MTVLCCIIALPAIKPSPFTCKHGCILDQVCYRTTTPGKVLLTVPSILDALHHPSSLGTFILLIQQQVGEHYSAHTPADQEALPQQLLNLPLSTRESRIQESAKSSQHLSSKTALFRDQNTVATKRIGTTAGFCPLNELLKTEVTLQPHSVQMAFLLSLQQTQSKQKGRNMYPVNFHKADRPVKLSLRSEA